ncbi:hypothetical protein BH09VER1_BH09VER1_43130 [soil metagenome]
MPKHISIRDIARVVGLHHTTVGLALRDSPKLKKATKEKICTVATKLGYRPDPMLSALISYRNSKRPATFHAVIAWINNWPDRDAMLSNPIYRSYFKGAAARAKDLGYVLQEFWMHEKGITPAKMRRILQARNITGLLIAPQPVGGIHLDLDFGEFSAVAFGYSMRPHMLHLVTNHHTQTIDLVIAKLVELGYRRPGYCILPPTDAGGNYIWISRLLHLYTRYPELSQIPRLPSLEKEAFAKWNRKYKPDVLIGFNMLFSAVEEMGYRVPEDFGIVSMAVDPENPSISGANENDFLIGRTALDVLVGMIHRGERGIPEVPIRTLVDSTWFRGETLPPKKV